MYNIYSKYKLTCEMLKNTNYTEVFKRAATKTSRPWSVSFSSRQTSRSAQALHSDRGLDCQFLHCVKHCVEALAHWSWLHRAPPSVTPSCAGHKCKKLEQRWIRRQWWKCNKLYLRMFVCIGTAVSSEDLGHKLQNSSSEPRFCLHTHNEPPEVCSSVRSAQFL